MRDALLRRSAHGPSGRNRRSETSNSARKRTKLLPVLAGRNLRRIPRAETNEGERNSSPSQETHGKNIRSLPCNSFTDQRRIRHRGHFDCTPLVARRHKPPASTFRRKTSTWAALVDHARLDLSVCSGLLHGGLREVTEPIGHWMKPGEYFRNARRSSSTLGRRSWRVEAKVGDFQLSSEKDEASPSFG